MKLIELPKLKEALDLVGVDNGADVRSNATIPKEWEVRCRIADDELRPFTSEEMETLTQGEETEMALLAKRAPAAHEVLNAAFDGELSEKFFRPWHNIFDARRAERRVSKQRAARA